MKVDLPFMGGLGINDDARLAREQRQALGRREDIISEALLANGPDRCRRKRVSHLDCRDKGRDKIDGQSVAYAASRLLVKSNGSEPAGKVANSRVNRRVVRSSYVPSVRPEEMSPAKLDSSSRGRRQI